MLREERHTHPVVLSHNDLNVTTVASSGGSIGGGAIALPLDLKSFFGNQFSQFVVIFLFQPFQGLRYSSSITNLSPRTVNVSAQFALTDQPTMTLILVSVLYVRQIQTCRNLTLRSTCMHVCWTYAKETTAVYFEVFTFDA